MDADGTGECYLNSAGGGPDFHYPAPHRIVAAAAMTTIGLCETCRHVHIVRSDRGSLFYLCRLSFTDSWFPKYPSLPVLRCAGFDPRGE